MILQSNHSFLVLLGFLILCTEANSSGEFPNSRKVAGVWGLCITIVDLALRRSSLVLIPFCCV
jgi:hypothetical protein